MDFQKTLAYFVEHEGRVTHLYLDTVGLVTVGIGRMLPTRAAAQELPFVVRGSSMPATPEQIAKEWETVFAQPKGKLASFYANCTVLDLPNAAIDVDFAKSITSFTATLRQRFPKLDSLPDSAQLGLLDMLYSMGAHELFAGFPHFCAAVDSEDWLACAQECRRGGVSDKRNDDCAALFKSAVIPS